MSIRQDRLKSLGQTFWVVYGTGDPETRWPDKPGRYAVDEYSDRYQESFWATVETLDDVRAAIADGGVNRVVDLDTGRDVSFTVSVALDAE